MGQNERKDSGAFQVYPKNDCLLCPLGVSCSSGINESNQVGEKEEEYCKGTDPSPDAVAIDPSLTLTTTAQAL